MTAGRTIPQREYFAGHPVLRTSDLDEARHRIGQTFCDHRLDVHGSRADLAVAVTGVAGPGGGSREKPVGLVHFGFARRGGEVHHLEERFDPELGRSGIRLATVAIAFAGLSNLMDR